MQAPDYATAGAGAAADDPGRRPRPTSPARAPGQDPTAPGFAGRAHYATVDSIVMLEQPFAKATREIRRNDSLRLGTTRE